MASVLESLEGYVASAAIVDFRFQVEGAARLWVVGFEQTGSWFRFSCRTFAVQVQDIEFGNALPRF